MLKMFTCIENPALGKALADSGHLLKDCIRALIVSY